MRLTVIPVVVFALLLSACSSASPPTYVPPVPETGDSTGSPEQSPAGEAPIGNACALLDADYLDDTLSSVDAPFGGQLDFRDPQQTSPSAFCAWKDPSIPAEIQIFLEDSATAELDDHSDRAFNIDVDPVIEPQDGPGEKAVILLDTAFDQQGSDALPYGYFFVHDGLAVYLKVTFVDIGRELLRVVAEEVKARIETM